MELVNEHVGALASFPVQRHAIEHGVGNDQQAGRLQLRSQPMNIKHHHPLIQVHIALLTEDIQRTGGIQFQRQGNLLGFRLCLLQHPFNVRDLAFCIHLILDALNLRL